MMMKRRIAAAALTMLLFGAGAAAQTLPGIACFSPGLVRMAECGAKTPSVSAEASVTIDHAAYARDLSVLDAMLSDTTLRYEGAKGLDRLSILSGGELLAQYALEQGESGAVLSIGGQPYALDSLLTGTAQADEPLSGVSVVERVPLASVAAWIEGLRAGDALPGGFSVVEPAVLGRTMSDDGTRLTKIEFLSGSIARGNEAPYVITGFLRQPAGRAPKDTFELVLTQDDDNFIELSYSALREQETTRKEKEGIASVNTSLKAAGKIAGSSFSSRLNVTMKNEWTADGENLHEKVRISASLSHTDRAPGRQMQRLNDVQASTRNVIRITTTETPQDVISFTDGVTFEVVMDGNTFLAGGADLAVSVGAEILPAHADAAGILPLDGAGSKAVIAQEAQRLAALLYENLGEKTKEKIAAGL